ncbi:hypothetical protein C8J57DRAFT_1235441 [Mycena rebaudengoi]|nr:hypothetical protein C8J57DRAFT_1235441 [Mycena rebaudengoi]
MWTRPTKASPCMKSKRKAESDYTASNHVLFRNTRVKRVQYTVATDAGSSTIINTLGRVPVAHASLQRDADKEIEKNMDSSELGVDANKRRTQNGQLLDDFAENFDDLAEYLLDREADDDTELPCLETKLWVLYRHDISKLGDHVIQLGHNGGPCREPVGERFFTAVDSNGVHSTKLAFCGCMEQPPNKLRQLMRAGLFPATTKDPHTAFTINMLKEFQLHNFESKKAAYDHLGAIRRLSDNSFTSDVANPYAAFLRVVRVYNYLVLKKRSGQLHGIDFLLPHRPPGNLLVWCPACPEPGFNSDPNCPKTPPHLRHLNQSQRTLDGNHQCNQFSKNTDPDDVSLCGGKAYFPLDSAYQDYLNSVPTSTEVVNKQDKKKFKNMAITGTVNCQCSHVFILSCVDLPHAERFANADYAVAMALRNHKPTEDFSFKLQIEVDDVDEAATYDIACAYVVNLEARFAKHFPDQLGSIKKMRWGVPALHVQGHQDSCTYLFGTAYMECIGHFHGETAEHYWPEANQLGPHVRQMNLGHQQDTMIQHHGDWNAKKMAKIASDLAEDLQSAKRKYLEKRNHYIGLSISFKDRVDEWQKMSRTTTKAGKEAISVYKHRETKGFAVSPYFILSWAYHYTVPSQASIYQKMIAQDDNFALTLVPKNKIAQFLDHGLRIQDTQRKLRHLIRNQAEHDLQAWRKEISTRTSKLRDQISTFRQDQKRFMPKAGDKVSAQTSAGPAIEDEKLFLPSDLTQLERQNMDVVALGIEESKWREGQVFDVLRALQHIVKALSSFRKRKLKHDRQQKQNSRAGDQITELTKRQSQHMETYNIARQAVISLNGSTQFPLLTEADLFMKSVQQKRHVGDSKRTDGLLFRATALATLGSYDQEDEAQMEDHVSDDAPVLSGTQMTRRKSGPKIKEQAKKSVGQTIERPKGWLWQLGKLTKMSDVEMEAWSSEGDRVQWFRAEAEMQRWQEQVEQKLVELLRTARSFTKMQAVWLALAERQPSHRRGAAAYTRQKAEMYAKRAGEARQKIKDTGYQELLEETANVVSFVDKQRRREAESIRQMLSQGH